MFSSHTGFQSGRHGAGCQQLQEQIESNDLYTHMHMNSPSLNNLPTSTFWKTVQLHKRSQKSSFNWLKKNFKKFPVCWNQCKRQIVSEATGLWLTFTEKRAALLQPFRHPTICSNLLPEPLTLQLTWQKKTWLCLMRFGSVGIFTWNSPFTGSLICLPELKQLRCRRVPSCYLRSEVQEGRELADRGSSNSQQQSSWAHLLPLWNSWNLCIHTRLAI